MNPLDIKIAFLKADIAIHQFARQEGYSHTPMSSMIPAYTKASDCVKPWHGSSGRTSKRYGCSSRKPSKGIIVEG